MGLTKEELVQKANQQAKNLQVQEIEDLAAAWKQLDIDGNETILVSEVDQFLTSLGINMTQEAKNSLILSLDKNNNGTISFIEFVMAYNDGTFKDFMG